MSRFDYARPQGRWVNAMTPGSADFRRWDVTQSKIVNGDTGGNAGLLGSAPWSPSAPIVVGGAGMTIKLNTGGGGAGGLRTELGGRAVISGDADAEFPQLQSFSQYQITIPMLSAHTLIELTGASWREEDYLVPVLGPNVWGITLQPGLSFPPNVYFEIPGRFLHNGAQLLHADLYFAVTQRPTSLPTSNPLYFLLVAIADDYTSINFLGPVGIAWSSGHAFALNAYVTPSGAATNKGFYYQATSISGTGTTGGAEPNWPNVIGNTVVDNPGANQIVWTCVGDFPQVALAGATISTYYAAGAPQKLSFDLLTNDVVDVNANKYLLYLVNMDSTITLISLALTFGGITDARFQ